MVALELQVRNTGETVLVDAEIEIYYFIPLLVIHS